MEVREIVKAVAAGRYRITDHADEEAANDGLTLDEILEALDDSEAIEDYPTDRPYPSCLLLGRLPSRRPVHMVWGYNASTKHAVLITVYRPDPERWVDWRKRRNAR